MSDPRTPVYPAYFTMALAKVYLTASPTPTIRKSLLAPGNVRLELLRQRAPAGASFEPSPVRTVAKRCRGGFINDVVNPAVRGIEAIAGRNVVPHQGAVAENHR